MAIYLGGHGKPGSMTGGDSSNVSRTLERVKSLTYSATVNKLLLDVEGDTTEGSVKTDDVGDIMIQNTGTVPAFAILAYRLWTADVTMSATTYHVNYLLKPGESLNIPDSPTVIADDTIEQLAGTAVTDTAPSSVNSGLLWKDITADLGAAVDATTEPITITTASNHTNFFRHLLVL